MSTAEKPGETRPLTPQDGLWLQGLLRYARNASVALPAREFLGADGQPARLGSGLVPNIFPVFAGFTWGYPGTLGLRLLVRSFRHTDHAGYTDAENQHAAENGGLSLPNAAVLLFNSQSADIGLVVEGRLREVPVSEEDMALAALNKVLQLKDHEEITLDPPSSLAERYAMYVLNPTTMYAQGRNYTDGLFVSEGHPVVGEALRGFDLLPPLADGQPPPNNRQELFDHLRASGFAHPALDATSRLEAVQLGYVFWRQHEVYGQQVFVDMGFLDGFGDG